MAGNAELVAHMKQWRQSLNKDDHWCILINADPDALASALALGYLTEAEFDSWVRPEEMVGSLAIR